MLCRKCYLKGIIVSFQTMQESLQIEMGYTRKNFVAEWYKHFKQVLYWQNKIYVGTPAECLKNTTTYVSWFVGLMTIIAR